MYVYEYDMPPPLLLKLVSTILLPLDLCRNIYVNKDTYVKAEKIVDLKFVYKNN